MLDLYELEQFVAFAELGTLSRVAEKFHISTPAITRSCTPAPLSGNDGFLCHLPE